jgi:hypothetical protein
LSSLVLAAACGSGSPAHGPPPASGGSSGRDAGGLDAGAGSAAPCAFQIDAAPSPTIPTVGVVDWSVNLPGLSEARIDFTLDDPAPGTINVGSGGAISVAGTMHRALMLGMKAQHTYTYRITAKNGATTCTSADRSFTTGASDGAPTVNRTVMNAAAQARGFIVTSGGYWDASSWPDAYIIDADGDVVWWSRSAAQCSRALMDWDGQTMWTLDANPALALGGSGVDTTGGQVISVAMDGTGTTVLQQDPYNRTHHDLTVLPGGVVAFLVWDARDTKSTLIERSADGTLKTVATLDASLFGPVTGDLHANSIMYHPTDDTYTVSDLQAGAYVKISRQGQLLWQFRKDCKDSTAPKCAAGANVAGNHGHHLLDDGHFLFFSAGPSTTAAVYEYLLTETATSLAATQLWSYMADGEGSDVLGDIQRLPNGNTLIDFSRSGEIRELSPTGEVIQVIEATGPTPNSTGHWAFGYFNFRETLYGPPLR